MGEKKIGIIGYGQIGPAMSKLFPDAVIYDKYKNIGTREAVNDCDAAFVCVSTPQAADGSCDTCEVDEVLSWCTCPVIILRSTVPVGYTDRKRAETGKHIVFQPEYLGETVSHPFADLRSRDWLIFGGTDGDVNRAVAVYQQVYNADIQIQIADARTVELAKYMENAFLAAKVTFCNEFFDIAEKLDVSYDRLRELWVTDPRIGRSHTFVYADNRGYGGSCLPKDMAAVICQAEEAGADVSLLRAVRDRNGKFNPAGI